MATVKSSFLFSFSSLFHSYICTSAGAHLIFCEPVQGIKAVVNYGSGVCVNNFSASLGLWTLSQMRTMAGPAVGDISSSDVTQLWSFGVEPQHIAVTDLKEINTFIGENSRIKPFRTFPSDKLCLNVNEF